MNHELSEIFNECVDRLAAAPRFTLESVRTVGKDICHIWSCKTAD